MTVSFVKTSDAGIRVQTYQGQVSAEVYNQYNRPIICTGRVWGRAYNGAQVSSWMNRVIVQPGAYAYVYVYTDAQYNPFVRGWSDIVCQAYNPS